MECGISILNKIRELQNTTLNLKKISNKIYDETTTKVKGINYYKEQIQSQEPILMERKKVRAELESENIILDQNIATWKAILDDKKQNLEKEKEELERLKNEIFSARINYCDSVFEFLNENVNLEEDLTSAEDAELETFRAKASVLEQELDILDKTIRDKKSAEFNLRLERKMKAEEAKCQKLLEDKKSKLRKLVKEIRMRKQMHANVKNYPKNVYEMTVATVSNVTHKRWAYAGLKNMLSAVQTQQTVHPLPIHKTQSSSQFDNKESLRFTQDYYTDLLKKYSNSISQGNDKPI